MYIEKVLLTALLLLGSFGLTVAQDGPPPDAPPRQQFDAAQSDQRPNLFRELGLTREQVQQIRRMNMARKPQMDEATRRLREANRNLDMAIYADNLDETEIQTRLREFHAAQAEVARLRFHSELSLRKILTPEQLVRFREIRQRFAEMREKRNDTSQDPGQNKPLRRILRQQNQARPN